MRIKSSSNLMLLALVLAALQACDGANGHAPNTSAKQRTTTPVPPAPPPPQKVEISDAQAQYELGISYTIGKGPKNWNYEQACDEAAILFRKAADQGHVPAQFSLGDYYAAKNNHEQAILWMRKAADNGSADAQRYLGLYFSHGAHGLPKSAEQAAFWYRQAAMQGESCSQVALANLYCRGEGVPRDLASAHCLFNLAASKGNLGADTLRDDLAQRMTSEQINRAQAMAQNWPNSATDMPTKAP